MINETKTAKITKIQKFREAYFVTFHRTKENVLMPDECLVGNALGIASYLSTLTITNFEILPTAIKKALNRKSIKTVREEVNLVLPADLPIVALYHGGSKTFAMAIDQGGDDLALVETTVYKNIWVWWFNEDALSWTTRNHQVIESLPINQTVKNTFKHVVSAVSVMKLLDKSI